MNREQAKQLKTVLKNAGAKLGAAMQAPEEERDMKAAFRGFVRQVRAVSASVCWIRSAIVCVLPVMMMVGMPATVARR